MSSLYEIQTHHTSSDSYFYSDTSYHFDIVRIEDKKVVKSFYGRWSSGTTHDERSGTESVSFLNDTTVLLVGFNGNTKQIVLNPVSE
jgi:hypothetical protein